ncbi:MAG: hypothetical protein JST92_05475 [Deltaproteobacteria bacterium]|nr:hypothetical protein [Deltaproteobacteria bacterium]
MRIVKKDKEELTLALTREELALVVKALEYVTAAPELKASFGAKLGTTPRAARTLATELAANAK